jgi:hypothetical protein
LELVSTQWTANAFDRRPGGGHHFNWLGPNALIFVEPEYPAVLSISYGHGHCVRNRGKIEGLVIVAQQ